MAGEQVTKEAQRRKEKLFPADNERKDSVKKGLQIPLNLHQAPKADKRTSSTNLLVFKDGQTVPEATLNPYPKKVNSSKSASKIQPAAAIEKQLKQLQIQTMKRDLSLAEVKKQLHQTAQQTSAARIAVGPALTVDFQPSSQAQNQAEQHMI